MPYKSRVQDGFCHFSFVQCGPISRYAIHREWHIGEKRSLFGTFGNVMNGTEILTTASRMLETHGANAKFLIAQKMDDAMVMGDGQAYDDWCMVAKAVHLMAQTREDAKRERSENLPPVVVPRAFRAA